ncbi:MAG: HAMP domain-containing histidine kinase [Oscillospiraceae bacterium]|jgi:signal transduction histidine kinase|nr:HAMP domain-containing histidine kinase [Oscillospiraceae bacterium]
MAKMTFKGLLNSLISTTFVLGLIFAACVIYIKDFFYSGVKQFINSKLSAIDTLSEQFKGPNLNDGMLNLLRDFAEEDKMELLLLDDRKNIITTSSGFSLTYKFETMKKLNVIDGNNVYLMQLGPQSVMMCEHYLTNGTGWIAAMVSLDEVDGETQMIIWILLIVILLILIFVVVSNTYFTNSIVNTIWTINRTANKIAKGDFNVRVERKTNDEIGELCDVINMMTEELGENERMGNEFISSISHELRTPLTVIKGWAETILSEISDTASLEKGLKIITAETSRLSKMVEELLDFSRLQNATTKLEREEVPLLTLISETIWMFEDRAKVEGKELLFGPELYKNIVIWADPNRLKQVLINIIDNALKYTESNGITKVTFYTESSGDTKWVIIKVEDNGCGIKKKDLAKVKTKFFKANYHKRGAGIGLAVADEIVTLHGGTLRIQSVEGGGTTVKISLPVYKRECV